MFKKKYLFLIMIVCLFAISAVSAEKIGNDTNMLVNDYDSSLIAESNDEDLLTDSYGTFQELQEEINAIDDGGTLNLTRDYKYVNGSTDGISINKQITIDGQGYTLDGNKLSRIFYVNANNIFLKNITLINGYSNEKGGAIYWNGNFGVLNNCSFVNCYLSSDDVATSGGAIYWRGNNGVLYDCTFVNSSSSSRGGSVYWYGADGALYNCTFVNSISSSYYFDALGGSVYWYGRNGTLFNCNFLNSILYSRKNCVGRSIAWYGADGVLYNCNFSSSSYTTWVRDYDVYWMGTTGSLYNCSFVNSPRAVYWEGTFGVLFNSTFMNSLSPSLGSGGAVSWDGVSGILSNCTFTNSSAYDGGAVAWFADKGTIYNCDFVNSSSSHSGGAVYWCGIFGVLNNCTFKNSYVRSFANAIYWKGLNGKINNSYFSPSLNTIDNTTNLQIIKKDSSLLCDNISFEYSSKVNFSAYLNHGGKVFFYMLNEDGIKKTFIVNTNNGIATLFEELNELCAGSWNVSVIFKGDDNYYPCDTTTKIIIYQSYSSLSISNTNATLDHEIVLIANVNSNLTVNEGVVTFFDNNTKIGQSNVNNGVATLNYTPTTDGEHIITAIFNSDNYFSSNCSAKLLVDSATVGVLVDGGVVGFNSTFVAEVKGLYSIVNEGNVKFYINDEYLDKVPVVDGSASINYIPLIAGDYTVSVIYCDSDKFLDDEDSTSYRVSQADTNTIVVDLNGTVGHDVVITATVTSSNNLIINEGSVVFFDGETEIGESQVTNGKATITYTPTTAGEHIITGIFNSDNYFSSNCSAKLLVDSATVDVLVDGGVVGFNSTFVAEVKGLYGVVNEGNVKFYIDDEYLGKVPVVDGSASINYIPLIAGDYTVNVIYCDSNKFLDDEDSTSYHVSQADTECVVVDLNGTVGHDVVITAAVTSSNKLTINEGSVVFFDGEIEIGESLVTNGKATITYIPTTAGEHAITAIFNSDNYLSSNDTCKLLVDSATVDVLVDGGVVGFNSTFVAEVKGLYGVVNEGNVKFYINDEYLGKVLVVDGSASISYVPLIAGDYVVSVIYCDSDKFLDDGDSSDYRVSKADSECVVVDLNGTVGHDVVITATVTSSNKLTINEGSVVFFDGEIEIGESLVTNGKATITYIPTTAGDHTITAIFNSDNYLSSNDTSVLSVKKANINLAIADIVPVLFTNPSNFTVNVNSNYKAVNEGKIKYYVNNDLVGTVNVDRGVANLDYVTTTSGSFTLVVVYDETSNYLSSNANATFIVNKMPTVLSAESVIFDEKGDKIFTTNLIDDNSIGVSGQNIKIETIKYSGESRIFNGITDMDGIAEYDVKNLEGGMWFVTGTYDGNGNYIGSKFSDKFIVIRMDTTTNIEGIDNHPQVNHTYKLKANIHDENGKLVKEGIVQFYLDGVDIGSIDLSKNNGHQSGLLGVSNPIDYILGDDDSDVYIEYTPSKAGKYTLSAVYEGTTIYKSSNETTTFIVEEDTSFNISAPDVTKFYGGSERFVVTLTDSNNNPVSGQEISININNVSYSRITDSNGMTSIALGLSSGEYEVTVNCGDISVISKVTILSTVRGSDVVKIYGNDTPFYATFLDSDGNYLTKGSDVRFNLNGTFYNQKIMDDKGNAKLDINEKPGEYIITAANLVTGELAPYNIIVISNIVENYDLTKYYNETDKFSVKVLSSDGTSASGQKVKFTIGNNTYESISNSNGYAFLETVLQPGEYLVKTSYGDLEVNNAIIIFATLYDKDMQVSSSDVYQGENEVIKVVLPNDATGKVSTTINNKEYSANVNNGVANIVIPDLRYGNYNIEVIYSGDSQYNSVRGTTSFVVEKTVDLSAPDVTKYYKGPERFVVTLKDLNNNPIANAKVKININGVNYDRTTGSNGQTTVALGIPAGNYTAFVEYDGIKVESNIIIKPTVSGNDITKIFRNGTQYYAKFIDTKGNALKNTPVEFNINGVFYKRTTNDQGVAKMNINLNPGEYIITAINPNSTEMHSNIVIVLPNIVDNHDLTKYYRNDSQYIVKILDDKGNPAAAGGTVTFNINGVLYKRTINATGHAKMNVNLAPGEYIITAEYNGYKTSNVIKVLPILEAKDLNMKYRDGSKFEVKLVDGKGKAFAGQKITFNINGVFYERTTGADGIARLNINLMAGEYIITSMYENGAAISNKVTIRS